MDGQNLSHMTDEELTIFRRRNIGFVFQQYNLVPMLNVWENIILPVKLDGKKVEKGYVDEIIDTLAFGQNWKIFQVHCQGVSSKGWQSQEH
mgnify:CR=1 FL=1